MKILRSSAFICGVGMLLISALPKSAIAATTEQRSCTFTLAALANAQSADVKVNVVVASRDGAARIRVKKSGEYTGTIRPTGAAQTATFRTPISRETITIGDAGDALWEIKYDAGKEPTPANRAVVFYVGSCKAPRKTP